MASIILGQAGSVIGGSVAGAIGSAVGYGLGSFMGGQLDQQFFSSNEAKHSNTGRISDFSIQTSTYGKVIAEIYGTVRIAGNIVWMSPVKENEATSSYHAGGKNGKKAYHTAYYYTVSLALAICQGEIDAILRVWADGKLLSLSAGSYRLYKGDEMQLPDSLIEAYEGKGKTPAYRGIAYVVIEDFPITQFGNRLPNFTFEVQKILRASSPDNPALEDMIKAMVVIPGSGEFVYDTQIQKRALVHKAADGVILHFGKYQNTNHHNHTDKTDAVLSLDQLQDTCRNLEWVAPVVTWFANDLDVANCQIMPGVEYNQDCGTLPEIWQVADFIRENAYLISRESMEGQIMAVL